MVIIVPRWPCPCRTCCLGVIGTGPPAALVNVSRSLSLSIAVTGMGNSGQVQVTVNGEASDARTVAEYFVRSRLMERPLSPPHRGIEPDPSPEPEQPPLWPPLNVAV